ncbi:MAG TPA: MFS transporter [Phycisphaerae bacterium]|nr:MFS transporter [Phycisphaerae bacterium]
MSSTTASAGTETVSADSLPSPVIVAPSLPARYRRRSLFFLGLAVAGVGFAMTLQLGLNASFVGQEMRLTGQQQGILEAFRESCGITALLILALLAGVAEPVIGAAVLVFLGVGLSAYSVVPTFPWLIITSLIWSQGLHIWMPLPNSMTLSLSEPGRSGHRLGQISAAGAAGSAAGLVLALVLHVGGVPIRPLWLLAGAAALLAAVACLAIPREIKAPRPRLVVRRRYATYYMLCLLEGWRKQIFIAFSGFLLVKVYGTPLTTMLVLWLTTQAIGWFLSPLIGRLIDRLGERRVLMTYYASMVVVFGGYIFLHNIHLLHALFVVDGAFFVMSMALTTYVGRIAPPEERTPTLSLGVAMNHVAAVSMPLLGGILWTHVGYQWTFAVGSLAAAASILGVFFIPAKRPALPA